MRFRLPAQSAFWNSCKHSTNELEQKQRLTFSNVSVVVQKQVGTRPRSNNATIYRIDHTSFAHILFITVEILMLVCAYIANQTPPCDSSLCVCYINGRKVIILVVKFFLHQRLESYYICGLTFCYISGGYLLPKWLLFIQNISPFLIG